MFPCLPENCDTDEPKKGKHKELPWSQCVDEKYQAENDHLKFRDAKSRYSILLPENRLPDEAFPTLLDRLMVGD